MNYLKIGSICTKELREHCPWLECGICKHCNIEELYHICSHCSKEFIFYLLNESSITLSNELKLDIEKRLSELVVEQL